MYFTQNKTISIGDAKAALGNSVSYSELKFVFKYMEYKGKVEF